MILTCAHFMVPWWYFITPTYAMNLFYSGGSEAVQDDVVPHLNGDILSIHTSRNEAWRVAPGLTETSSKDKLVHDLERTLEGWHQSPSLPAAEVDSPKLIKSMLKSEMETWPRYIHDILKTKTSYKIIPFWSFLVVISEFMSTPILQKTFFEFSKENERLLKDQVWEDYENKKMLKYVLNKYEIKIKEHVNLLKQKDKPKEVIDIFTRDAQEHLGEYKICLEKQWSSNAEVELYRNWASHLSVYINVKGAVKAALETQAIQVSWIKFGKLNALGYVGVPYEIREPFKDGLSKQCQAITSELVDSIQLLNDRSLLEFFTYQAEYDYGIYDQYFIEPHDDIRKTLVFWVKYMPFYLKMRMNEDTWNWQCLMEAIIVSDPKGDHLEPIMQKFLRLPPPSSTKKNLIVRFLEFLLKKTKHGDLREVAQQGLEEIRASPVPSFAKHPK
ncbi:uncharacterized protein MELLADRAFT_58871 [Melampsora larici-populina 98AG31]|uniref:Secreted protein n=1 Tax=Melampsora larici-populina (strain 98AG31 / pathotype 3-4-7) TaxID=747676 RepID=F4R687_MELLP|nr:uncharacterized protein MELLADRAFT_58871 [Melampsora larici-populina 98AG31]EGG11840.1 hypothetical protein MELLADRAFT_58871 [Melampsora larici-populina 98AG31]